MDLWLWLMIILVVVVLGLFILLKYLSRDPYRKISSYNDIVSPADGKIIEILPFDNTSKMTIEKNISKIVAYTEDVSLRGNMVTIYTKWNDIHYNRMPITGTIHKWKQVHGKSYSPKDTEVVLTNTRIEMMVEGKIKLKIIQVAGNFLSVIKNFVKPGQSLQKGDKFGNISFASQTIVILPENASLKVKIGQKILAGETVIADFQEKKMQSEGIKG